jgi:peptidoglycan/xylan/chitin deacetylase (PgdA/CDA1 family)
MNGRAGHSGKPLDLRICRRTVCGEAVASMSLSPYRALKRATLHTLRALGAFEACARATSGGLRILCYHGFSLLDEHRFRGKLFMHPERFRARMAWLSASRYKVIALDEAVTRLNEDTLPERAVVITFDDGWFGCHAHAFPVLAEFGFPATLYVTSYYVQQQRPVLNLAVDYLLWRGRDSTLDVSRVDPVLEGIFDLNDPARRQEAASIIVTYADSQLPAAERTGLVYALAEQFRLDPVALFERQRICTLMTSEEIAESASRGISMQLHTHRHRIPLDDDERHPVAATCGISAIRAGSTTGASGPRCARAVS